MALTASAFGVWGAEPKPAPAYVEPEIMLTNREVNGSSGLAAASRPGWFWTHNDGADNRLFAFDKEGRNQGTWSLPGVTPHDMEEMAGFDLNGERHLLLADTGNNRTPERTPASVFQLHIVKEPNIIRRGGSDIPAGPVRTVAFRYEGARVDTEAVAVDPKRDLILLINKVPRAEHPSATLTTNVYSLKLSEAMKADRTLTAKILLKAMPPLPEQITGMDISPDGSKAVIQTYDDAYEFDFTGDWKTTFLRPYSRKIPVKVEPTGHPKGYTFREAICYGHDGSSLYITRELSSWEIENTNHRTPLWKIP